VRATMFIDVLSHWCLAAIPAARVLADLTPNLEIVFAPGRDGGPLGYSADLMRWYYKRGAISYGREMNATWFEGPQTRSWFANAVALVGIDITGDPLRLTHAVMSAALEQGLAMGRADECYAFVGKYLGLSASEIAKRVSDPAVKAKLDEGNARLAALGADERPTFVLENEIGDRVLLKGMWQKELVAAAGLALLHDQRAYNLAGPPPS
jgi:hypothetical protein